MELHIIDTHAHQLVQLLLKIIYKLRHAYISGCLHYSGIISVCFLTPLDSSRESHQDNYPVCIYSPTETFPAKTFFARNFEISVKRAGVRSRNTLHSSVT